MEKKSETVAAVIVTYNNGQMLKELLQDILAQSRMPDEIIVVDNASIDATERIVKDNFTNIKYIRLAQNSGTAGGFSEGIKVAFESSDFILTLDDDIRVPRDSLEELIKGFENLEGLENIGIARSVGKKDSLAAPRMMGSFTWRGSLMKAKIFKKLGLPDKAFFMYVEAAEYSLRLKENGYSLFWIPASECTEKRTDDKIKYRLFGREIKVYTQGFRLYYAFRNTIYIYLKYRKFKQLISAFFYGLEVISCIIFYEGLKGLSKIKAIQRGIVDGLRGRLGKIDS